MKVFGGLAELYFGVTGYISDILSYSRLLALGLATGIIGMVVNLIGSMLNDMVPYVGWILMIVVLIGGHVLLFGHFIIFIYLCQGFDHIAARLGEVERHLNKLAPAVGKTVGQYAFERFRGISR